MKTWHKIIIGDSRCMQEVSDESVHLFKEKSKLTQEEWNQYLTEHWNFPGEKQDKHLAMFPEKLPKRLIKMFSFVGDIVLDPFLGNDIIYLRGGAS